MSALSTIVAVRQYLQASFPLHTLTEKARGANGHEFTLSREGSLYTVTVKRAFLDDHQPNDIEALLRQWNVARTMKTSGSPYLLVGNGGPCAVWPEAPPS